MLEVGDYTLEASSVDDVMVITCAGEIDMAAAGPLLDRITDALGEGPVVVDVSAVTFLDCMALGALVSGYVLGRAMDRSFAMAEPSVAVLRVLDLTGTVHRLELFSCVPSAVRAAKRSHVLDLTSGTVLV